MLTLVGGSVLHMDHKRCWHRIRIWTVVTCERATQFELDEWDCGMYEEPEVSACFSPTKRQGRTEAHAAVRYDQGTEILGEDMAHAVGIGLRVARP